MQKFHIVTEESPVYREYLKYKEMSERVNAAFVEFAKEIDLDTHEYYQCVDELHIVPAQRDIERFGDQFKKNQPGCFKKQSPISKQWVSKCHALGLKAPHRPFLPIYFNAHGGTRSSQFMIDGVMYAAFEADGDFDSPVGFQEMKASEYYKIVEDYEASLSDKGQQGEPDEKKPG